MEFPEIVKHRKQETEETFVVVNWECLRLCPSVYGASFKPPQLLSNLIREMKLEASQVTRLICTELFTRSTKSINEKKEINETWKQKSLKLCMVMIVFCYFSERKIFPWISPVRIEKLMCELDARCKMRRQRIWKKKIIHFSIMLKMYKCRLKKQKWHEKGNKQKSSSHTHNCAVRIFLSNHPYVVLVKLFLDCL